MKRSVLFVAVYSMFLICRCAIPYSGGGGTSDTGNAKVSAIIHKPLGGRAANALVTVCPAGYHSAVGADSSEKRRLYVKSTVTDDTGYFEIDTIEAGDYMIEVNDGLSNATVMQLCFLGAEDSTVVLEDTLEPYAVIEGRVGSVEDTSIDRYFVIYGLDRRVAIDRDGSFIVDNIPAGTFHCRIVSSKSSWQSVDFKEVNAGSGQKTVIVSDTGDTSHRSDSIHSTEIVLNTSFNGADVRDDVLGFPVLLRLTGDNFNFVEADSEGNDIRFVKSDGTPLPFALESWDAVRHTAVVWVRIDTVYGNNDSQSFLMLWGKTSAAAPETRKAVFDTSEGFLACYHLNGTLKDATPHRFNGIDYGTTDASNGIIGRARSFNGISQYFSAGDLPDRQSGTISCWFKLKTTVNSSTTKTQGIWGKKESDDVNFSLSLSGTDFFLSNDINQSSYFGRLISKLEQPRVGYYLVSTTATFNAGQWYFVAWNWGNGGDSLYVNGKLEASTQNSLTVSANADDEIGRNQFDYNNVPGGGPRYFGGTIDEFRIDNTCRSAAWIRLSYMNQRPDDRLVTIRRMNGKRN